MTPDTAERLAAVWAELETSNGFARTYTSLCRAMEKVNDREQYAAAVTGLVRGLADQHRDLVEMIVVTGRALPASATPTAGPAGIDPLDFLAAGLADKRADHAD